MTKSRTCPVCRSSCNDSSVSLCRLHLQSVNNLDTSASYLDSTVLKDSLVCAKNKEIEDLQKQLDSCRITIEKIRNYYKETMKLNKHIGIELALDSKDEPIIDLSESPTLPAVSAVSAVASSSIRAARISNAARANPGAMRNIVITAARARCEYKITNFHQSLNQKYFLRSGTTRSSSNYLSLSNFCVSCTKLSFPTWFQSTISKRK